MNEKQYKNLLNIAEGRIRKAETETELDNWLDGITDALYCAGDVETMVRIEARVNIIWANKRLEGMI